MMMTIKERAMADGGRQVRDGDAMVVEAQVLTTSVPVCLSLVPWLELLLIFLAS